MQYEGFIATVRERAGFSDRDASAWRAPRCRRCRSGSRPARSRTSRSGCPSRPAAAPSRKGLPSALIGFALALFVAHRRVRDRRMLLGLALFYAINAALAGLADPVYALAALVAALIPEAALALTLAFLDVVSDAADTPR